MKERIYIAPVGLEFQRILAGIKHVHPSTCYLLVSDENNGVKKDSQRRLVEQSLEYANRIENLYKNLHTLRIERRSCTFVNFYKMTEQFCQVLAEVFSLEDRDTQLDEVWINMGTGNKLFGPISMYVASFCKKPIYICYERALKYTINKLDHEDENRESILHFFEEYGMTYSDEELDDYEFVEIPIIASKDLSNKSKRILDYLLEEDEHTFVSKWKDFVDMLSTLDKDYDKGDTKKQKSIKMKYYHHLSQLEEQKIIVGEIDNRKKRYKLTKGGIILAIAANILKDYI